MDTQNSQKRSPRGSAKTKQETTTEPEPRQRKGSVSDDQDEEPYFDRSLDHVARVRAAKETAQRKMEDFGDPSEYDISYIHGQLKEEPLNTAVQPSLDFGQEGEGK